MLLCKDFTFDAAHNLVDYHGKCERLHGHTYRLRVVLEGEPDAEGMIMDFLELKAIVKERVLSQLDHSYINDIIQQPSAENIALWIWGELKERLRRRNCELYEVHVWETADSRVILRREDMAHERRTERI
ncbi:MAG: 6-carboxytetrahydropterin synthase QueD [Synergistaceae bacterium]|nr:6-carboxytetrahydropterin synthase QueD [Synergistaceae bacterium]